jgi:hypothetical protein
MLVEFESPSLLIMYGLILLTAIAVNVLIYKHLQSKFYPTLPSVFPNNPFRDSYLSLLSTSELIPSHILQAALLLRAKECISRLRTLQHFRSSSKALLGEQLIPHQFLDMMRLAERQLRKEVMDTCNEAYHMGGNEWRSVILDQANECWLKDEIEKVLLQARKNAGSEPEVQQFCNLWHG